MFSLLGRFGSSLADGLAGGLAGGLAFVVESMPRALEILSFVVTDAVPASCSSQKAAEVWLPAIFAAESCENR